jgi:hypothetical protein
MTTTDERPADAPPKPEQDGTEHVLAAIREVMAQVRGFAKTGEMRVGYGQNAKVQYHFQKWDDMADAIGKAFRDQGIATQTVIREVDRYRFDKTKQNGDVQLWVHTSVQVRFVFTSLVDGSTFTVESAGEALDNSDKGVNKAITAAYKNACKVAFTLSTADDGDPDASRPEPTGERVRNAQNGQPQHQPPPEPVWQRVERTARGQSEPDPEPSRVEIATRVKASLGNAHTSGDLAKLAEWAEGKGCLATDVDGNMLARWFMSTLGTLPVGPPTERQQTQQQAPADDARASTEPPPPAAERY